jgi:hypothetical protein
VDFFRKLEARGWMLERRETPKRSELPVAKSRREMGRR